MYNSTKVAPKIKIKCICTVFRPIDKVRNISTNSSIKVSVCRGSCDGYVKHKRNNPTCDFQGNEKCNFISIAFSINVLIRNENLTSEEGNTKNR